jgi:hypothetical protein
MRIYFFSFLIANIFVSVDLREGDTVGSLQNIEPFGLAPKILSNKDLPSATNQNLRLTAGDMIV